MKRFPIRVRLTAAFASAMALVLALVGAFLYLRLESSLDASIDSGLRSRADDVAALVAQADSGLAQGGSSRLTESGESFAQVLTRSGRVVDSTPGARLSALDVQRIRSLRAATILGNQTVGGIEGSARLLATPVTAQGTHLVVVVGAATSEREDALNGLLGAFAIGAPIAVLLASGLGYLLASAGLAPVEGLRRRADQITFEHDGERLPIPDANDEIRRLGETLNAMLARLEASFARERAFTADASHELRTPLAVLKAELEVTLRGEGYDEPTRAALTSAAEEVDQLVRLSEDLLLIARSEDGALEVRPQATDVRGLLETVIARYDDRATAAGRAVELQSPEDQRAELDPLRIRQAVGNLIDNSLRHGSGTTVVGVETDDEALVLSISDQGSGFPREFLATAFERFTRADPARRRGGAGLGLPIVRAIARAHGGEATISPAGPGARIVLRLPLSQPCHSADLDSPSGKRRSNQKESK